MHTVIFKSYFLTKGLYWIGGLAVIVVTPVFLNFKVGMGFGYGISAMIMGLGSMVVFYLNRFEPHYIKFDDKEFTVDYINKVFFKTPTRTFLKNDTSHSLENDVLTISDSGEKKAIIRRKAVDVNDWDVLKLYFS